LFVLKGAILPNNINNVTIIYSGVCYDDDDDEIGRSAAVFSRAAD